MSEKFRGPEKYLVVQKETPIKPTINTMNVFWPMTQAQLNRF